MASTAEDFVKSISGMVAKANKYFKNKQKEEEVWRRSITPPARALKKAKLKLAVVRKLEKEGVVYDKGTEVILDAVDATWHVVWRQFDELHRCDGDEVYATKAKLLAALDEMVDALWRVIARDRHSLRLNEKELDAVAAALWALEKARKTNKEECARAKLTEVNICGKTEKVDLRKIDSEIKFLSALMTDITNRKKHVEACERETKAFLREIGGLIKATKAARVR